MKTKDYAELKKLDIEKLNKELEEVRKAKFEIEFKVKTGESKSLHLIKIYRRYIAQIKTTLHEKQLESSNDKAAMKQEAAINQAA